MIRISYELYGNDYTRRENLQKSFSSLEELHKWIVDNAYITSSALGKIYYPSENGFERISFYTQTMNCFHGYRWCDCWIHKIESERGIEFTDGQYTQGQKHKSQQIKELFSKWYKEDNQPKQYNFAN